MGKSRERLRAMLRARKDINAEIQCIKKEYLKEYEGVQVVWISDHAIVRYIERVLGEKVPESHLGEKDSVVKYLTRNGLDGLEFRNQILSVEEQHEIMQKDITFYVKGGWTYVLRDYTLVSIIPTKDKFMS